MYLLNSSLPLLCRKQADPNLELLPGFWRVHWQIGNCTIISTFYSRIDQACILWGLITAAIFMTAQFIPLSWQVQAIIWSVLSIVGSVGMVWLTKIWVKAERLEWLLYAWVALMLVGVLVTDLSIFLGWGQVLLHLCNLWLGLSAIGYFCTGIAMRSRTFTITGLIHLLTILILPYFGAWQFLITGIVMGLSVILLAELQWDSIGTCSGHEAEKQLSVGGTGLAINSHLQPMTSIQNSPVHQSPVTSHQ